jgi:hypothetical protein
MRWRRALLRDVSITVRLGHDVILDLAELENIDMSGIRAIRRIQQAVSVSGGQSHIRGATADTRRMLKYSSLRRHWRERSHSVRDAPVRASVQTTRCPLYGPDPDTSVGLQVVYPAGASSRRGQGCPVPRLAARHRGPSQMTALVAKPQT